MASPLLTNCDDLLQQVSSENLELLEQIGLYLTLEKVDQAENFYKAVVAARLLRHFWKKLSRRNEIEACRNEAILAIAEFVKNNPRATEQQVLTEIQKQIDKFVEKMG